MRRLRTVLSTALLAVTLALTCLAGASEHHDAAVTVAVYPFASQDVILGVAIADRVAQAIATAADARALGPGETPALIPPLVVQGGFLSPVNLLRGDGTLDDRNGAALLRETLGVAAAVTGQLRITDELELELHVATPERVRSYTLRAPEGEPGLLARNAARTVSTFLALATQPTATGIDLAGPHGYFARGLALLGAGFPEEARASIDVALADLGDADPAERQRWSATLRDIERALALERGDDLALQAAVALSRQPFDEPFVLELFTALEHAGTMPAAALWRATMQVSAGIEGAGEAFDRAAVYPYGVAARAMFRAARDLPGYEADARAALGSRSRAALIAASLAAQAAGDSALERTLLEDLARVAPALTYPFERLSFLAFDADDALAAATALSVAVELDPESDLYWTNLGWAQYLLGFLEASEASSMQALEFAPNQVVAWYNLGLVRTVTGRLDEADLTYRQALDLDDGVNAEAIEDLEEALRLYPDEPGVHYALALLLEGDRQRERAAEQYERFLERAPGAALANTARTRLAVLRAPPAPLEIAAGARIGLGPAALPATTFQPGDRLYPVFELATPAFELPEDIALEYRVVDADGETVASAAPLDDLRVSPNIVAIRVDGTGVTLPTDLPAGRYALEIEATADTGQVATAALEFDVAGEAAVARQLASRNVVLRSLELGTPFVRPRDAASATDARLIGDLLQELREVAELAEDALPTIEDGRFAGLTGGALFRESDERDVRDFLAYLLGQDPLDADFTFVDAYAQWAITGAPTE